MKRFLSTPFLSTALLVAAATAGGSLIAHAAPYTTAAIAEGGGQDSSASSVAGSWTLSFTDPQGTARQASLQLQQDGSKISGTFQGQRGSGAVSGSMQGNQVSMTVKGRGGREMSFSGTVDGSKMSGTTAQGSSWSATRQ